MGVGLLFDCDEQVARHIFTAYNQPALKYDRCLGIIGGDGKLAGAVFLHNYNGSNVELSYYGQGTLSAGVIKTLARFIVCTFDPSRLTVTVSKKKRRLLRSLQRLGFRIEGTRRCYYGVRDCPRNTGVSLVAFRERVDAVGASAYAGQKVSAC